MKLYKYMRLLKDSKMRFILLPYKYAYKEDWVHEYIKYMPMQNLNNRYTVKENKQLSDWVKCSIVKRKLLIDNFPVEDISVQDFVDKLKNKLNDFIISRNLDKLKIGDIIDDKYLYLGVTDKYKFRIFDIGDCSMYTSEGLTYQKKEEMNETVYLLNYRDYAEKELNKVIKCIN